MQKFRYFSIFFVALILSASPLVFSAHDGLHTLTALAQSAQATPNNDPGWISWAFSSVAGSALGTGSSYFFGGIAAILGTLINGISTFFLSMAGLLFDQAINYSITNFGDTLNGNVMTSINMVWSVFRDLSNIIIIGMFVFVGFATILGNHTYNIKQFAIKICVVAVLINFSLFFTKAVIDVSNFVAYQFFKGTSSLQVQLQANGTEKKTGIGIASRLMTSVGATGGLAGSTTGSGTKQIWDNVGSNFVGVLVTIMGLFAFTLLATVILFYGVFQLIYRIVMLIILMAVSSLATVAFLIPKFKTYQEQWLSALFQQAIFAPLLMMMLWAITAISDALVGNVNRSMTLSKAMTDLTDPGAGAVLINYFVICGLLFGAIKLASSLSAKSDSLLFGIGGWLNKLNASGRMVAGARTLGQNMKGTIIDRENARRVAALEAGMGLHSSENDIKKLMAAKGRQSAGTLGADGKLSKALKGINDGMQKLNKATTPKEAEKGYLKRKKEDSKHHDEEDKLEQLARKAIMDKVVGTGADREAKLKEQYEAEKAKLLDAKKFGTAQQEGAQGAELKKSFDNLASEIKGQVRPGEKKNYDEAQSALNTAQAERKKFADDNQTKLAAGGTGARAEQIKLSEYDESIRKITSRLKDASTAFNAELSNDELNKFVATTGDAGKTSDYLALKKGYAANQERMRDFTATAKKIDAEMPSFNAYASAMKAQQSKQFGVNEDTVKNALRSKRQSQRDAEQAARIQSSFAPPAAPAAPSGGGAPAAPAGGGDDHH